MTWRGMADGVVGVAMRVFADRDADTQESTLRYFPLGGSSYSFDGTFDEDFIDMDAGLNVSVGSKQPMVGTQLTQLQALPKEGDKVRVRGTMYRVVDSQPDGVAAILLVLMK